MTELHISTHPQQSANVFASAGSGKTWLLITRICRLLLAGTEPQQILAITFTRKSAAEMRARLFDKLASWAAMDEDALINELNLINEDPSAEKINIARNLYEQLLFSEQAIRISTFHAFCEEIIRAFPLESELPTTFELTEYEHIYINQAWQRLLTTCEKSGKSKLSTHLHTLFEFCYGPNGTKSALINFLHARSEWHAYTRGTKDPALFSYQQLVKSVGPAESTNSNARLNSETDINKLKQYCELLRTSPAKTYQAWADKISNTLHIAEQDNDIYINQLRTVFLTTDDKPRKLTISKAWQKLLSADQAQLIEQTHKAFSSEILSILDQQIHSRLLAANQAWFHVGNELLKLYQQIKFEHGVIDFSDLEWETYRLLQHEDHALWVQYKLGQRIQHFLVDEFQDTNPIQWHLLKPLIESSHDLNQPEKNSLFLVGDVKQSIYRFRGANPEIQALAADWSEQTLASQQLSNDHSWRSSPAIIDCVNRIFTHSTIQAQFNTFNLHSVQHGKRWGYVKIYPLITLNAKREQENFRNPLNTAIENSEQTAHHQEGSLIAEQIHDLIKNKTPIYDNDIIRPAQFGDILILTRTRSHLDDIKTGLIHAGIPFNSNDAVKLLDFLEVNDLLTLLTCLIDPYDDLAFTQLLRSPIFNINEDTLINLHLINASTWKEKLDIALQQDHTQQPLLIVNSKLNEWKALADRIPVHDLLNHIYSDWHVLERYRAALPAADIEHACGRLNQLLQQSLEIDSGRYSSISRFIRKIKETNPTTIYVGESENINAVNIMTVHGAKGLEAPIVFIADSGPLSEPSEQFSALTHWPTSSDIPDTFMLTCKKSAMSKSATNLKDHINSSNNEGLNLLYVALTRAKQVLIMTGVESMKSTQQGWHAQCCGALEIEFSEQQAWVSEHANKPNLDTREDDGSNDDNSISYNPNLFEPLSENIDATGTIEETLPEAIEGIVIHKLLEILPQHPDINDNALLNRTLRETNLSLSSEAFAPLKQEALNCVTHPDLKEVFYPSHGQRIFHEVSVTNASKSDQVNIIDHMIVSKEGIWIIDFKTQTDVSKDNAQNEALKYTQQLRRYAQAIQPIYQTLPIRCSVVFTKIFTLVDVPMQ